MACSGTYLVPTEDGGSPPTDALAPPSATGGPLDASAEARPPDGPIVDAAPPDAARSPCATPSLFCDDFDEVGGGPGAKWSSTDTTAGAFDFDETAFVSPRRAVRVQVVPGQGSRSSSLAKHIDVPPTGNLRISFDARFDRPPGPFGEIDPLVITFLPLAPGNKMQLFAVATYRETENFELFQEFTRGGSSHSDTPLVVSYGKYQHYDIVLRSSGGNVTATLTIDGQAPATLSLAASPVTKITLSIGAPHTFNADTTATLRFDNVRVEPL